MKKKVFANQKEEARYYDNLDFAQYLRDKKPVKLLYPNLKPTKKPISLRLPEYLIETIKAEAVSRDIPYQILIREALKEKFIPQHSRAGK